jgi:membrane protein DedA with SNARE-associated domain
MVPIVPENKKTGAYMFTAIETFFLTDLTRIYDAVDWLGVTGFLVFENATGSVPGEIFLGLAGWMLLAAHGLLFISIFLWGAIVAIGSTISASIAYWAARIGGRPLVNRTLRWFQIDPQQAQRAGKQFQTWGINFVLMERKIPGVRTIINLPAGLAQISYIRSLVYTLIGSYIWCTLMIGIIYFTGEERWLISDFINQSVSWLLVTGILASIGAYLWKLTMKHRLQGETYLTKGD